MRNKIHKAVSNPSKIQNRTFMDCAGAGKQVSGTGRAKEIVADSTAVTKILADEVLRLANTTTGVTFVWIGSKEADAPATVDATNGLAIMPETVEHLFAGVDSENKQGCSFVKTSSAGVQLAILED